MTGTTKPKRKSSVFWTQEEIEKICERLILKGVRESSHDFLPRVREAQQMLLPQERQKTIGTKDHVKVIFPTLKKKADHAAHIHKIIEENKAAETERSQPAPETPQAPPTDLLSSILQTIATQVADAFAGHLKTAIDQAMERLLNTEAPGVIQNQPGQAIAQAHKLKKQKILVVGLKPGQAGLIAHEFKDMDLRFVESGTSPQLIHGKTGGMDAVIAMTNFIGHEHENVMKSAHNYIRCGGGLDKLRQQLVGLRAH